MIINERYDDKFLNLITLEFDKHRKIKKRVKDSLHYVKIDDKIIEEDKEKYFTNLEKKETNKLRIVTYDWFIIPQHNASERYTASIYYNDDKVADISISNAGYVIDIILNYKLIYKYYDKNLKPRLLRFMEQNWVVYYPGFEEHYFAAITDLQLHVTLMKSIYKNERYLK